MRERIAIAILLFAVCSVCNLAAADGNACDLWSLNGVRLGMSEAEVGALHALGKPGKLAKKLKREGWKAREVEPIGATAYFGPDGSLSSWFVKVPRFDEARLQLAAKLGQPLQEQPGGYLQDAKAEWLSHECQAQIVLEVLGLFPVATLSRPASISGLAD